MKKAKLTAAAGLLALVIGICCKSIRGAAVEEIAGVTIIDIKSDKFFWLLEPWKDGKLATMDGWARFSELSFEGGRAYQDKTGG
jgi:hypothetical protein